MVQCVKWRRRQYLIATEKFEVLLLQGQLKTNISSSHYLSVIMKQLLRTCTNLQRLRYSQTQLLSQQPQQQQLGYHRL